MVKNVSLGRFIVFEGIDGAGSETQAKLLFKHLQKKRKNVKKLDYPDYKRPIGRLIHQFLHEKYDFNVEVQSLLHLADFIKDKELITKWLKEGRIIICDRYFTSTITYQGLRNFPVDQLLKIANLFQIPRPDIVVYLEVSPGTSIKRKLKEKKNLDRNENNKKFLNEASKAYRNLVQNQIFAKWIVIDGRNSIKEVFQEVIKSLKKMEILKG